MSEQISNDAGAIATVRPGTSRISQLVTLVAVIIPPLGILSAMGLLWGVAFHWADVGLLGASVLSLALHPSDPDKLFAGTSSSGILSTSSGGVLAGTIE